MELNRRDRRAEAEIAALEAEIAALEAEEAEAELAAEEAEAELAKAKAELAALEAEEAEAEKAKATLEGKPVITDANNAEFKKWKKDNFSPRWGLLQYPGADYSVHLTFQTYLDAIGYDSPEKLWGLDDHGSGLIEKIRKQHKALPKALKLDRNSVDVEKYLSEEMLKEYKNSKRSPQEREIAEALAKAKAAETAAIIELLTGEGSKPDECEASTMALDRLCHYLQTKDLLAVIKQMKIYSFVKKQLDSCEPWSLVGMSKEEWLEPFLQLAGVLPKPKKPKEIVEKL
jgi:hypothetical protein